MSVPPFSDILGQPEAVEFLRGVAARRRFANAYLLHGPPGVGKGTAALAFARAILCETGVPKAQESLFGAGETVPVRPADLPPGEACGVCSACAKSGSLQHPDLKFLFPVSGEESKLESAVIETLDRWREDPLFVFTYEKAASIRISLTRDLLRDLAYKPFEAARRVVVVRDADRMREDQYSAMLKAIEEPGDNVWVLTTARLSRLPATIRSRCQRVRFRPLAEGLVREILAERVGLDEKSSRMLAALSSGSLGRALLLRDSNPLDARNQALALLEPALRGDFAGLLRAVQGANPYGKAGRESLRRTIEYQMLWQRDLLRARYEAPREDLVHRDREAEIRRQAGQVDATEIRRRLMILEEALRAIEGNVSVDLALFSAMSRIADPSRSRTGWPRHATARWQY